MTLEFSVDKCLTVSPVVFLMSIANKSKEMSFSCIYSPVFLQLLATNNYGNNDTLLQLMGICKVSHSFLHEILLNEIYEFLLWNSFTNIIKKTYSAWTLFTFCNSHSFKLAYKSNKFPFLRINFFFLRIRIKLFVFIFFVSFVWIRQNEQTKLVNFLYNFSSPRYLDF